jgi:hypothetical protein
MPRTFAFVAALAALLAGGALYRNVAGTSQEFDDACARVIAVPYDFGDWKGAPLEADDRAFRSAGAQRYWMRSYSNERLKTSLLVVLMAGRAGKMSVHTPEICYRGAGYEMADAPAPADFKSELGEDLGRFWTAKFSKKAGVTTDLKLLWGWNADGLWQAPDSPRWHFRGQPFLYKLYISHDLTGLSGAAAGPGPVQDFARQFLPEASRALFPSLQTSDSR